MSAFFLSLFTITIIFELYAFVLYQQESKRPLPENVGNFERVRKKVSKAPGEKEFLFAVVGDTKGHGTFEQIYEQLEKEPLSFLVLLGDCVRRGTEGYHTYFQAEWHELRPLFPVFYVVGNHDIDEKRFSVKRFEEAYGPTNCFFEHNGNLFILLRMLDSPYSNKESLDFLERILSSKASRVKRIFLFMHIPPKVSSDYFVRSIDGRERLLSLIDRYRVNYVIGSDFHGYARVKEKNTVYLVTGGGGAHLRVVPFKQFHHAIVFRVGENDLSERIIVVPRHEETQDGIERYIISEAMPWVKENRITVGFLNIAVVFGLYFSINLLKRAFQVDDRNDFTIREKSRVK